MAPKKPEKKGYLFSFCKNQTLLGFDAMSIPEVVITNSEMPTGTRSQQSIAQILLKERF